MDKLDVFNQRQIREGIPKIKPGYVVKVHQKIKEDSGKGKSKKNKTKKSSETRIQIFEGLVIAKKGEKGSNATFTVRKESYGIGVERVFPLYSPLIEKIEVVKKMRVRRAKLYYMRGRSGKQARLKEIIEKKQETKDAEK